MNEKPAIYEQAITTARSAEVLALAHGFKSVMHLADSLPDAARVLDVGAGASPFGRRIASLRPDVTWINIDYNYRDERILHEASSDAPDNLHFVAGDATKLTENYATESFDAVFSYWLLPHLSLDEIKPAVVAARAMFDVTKPGGLISVGPIKRRFQSSVTRSAQSVIKDEARDNSAYATSVATATKLTGTERYLQRISNNVATPFFGTTRYVQQDGNETKIYNPTSGEYVSRSTPEGMYILGRLALAMTKYTLGMSR